MFRKQHEARKDIINVLLYFQLSLVIWSWRRLSAIVLQSLNKKHEVEKKKAQDISYNYNTWGGRAKENGRYLLWITWKEENGQNNEGTWVVTVKSDRDR